MLNQEDPTNPSNQVASERTTLWRFRLGIRRDFCATHKVIAIRGRPLTILTFLSDVTSMAG
jgi:hypothetical protein